MFIYTMTKTLEIALIGAGIGGLAAANLLAKQNHQVTVLDQFTQPEPVGSGLVIQPVGQSVLQAVGVLPQAMQAGNPISLLTGHTAPSGRQVLNVSYGADRCGLAIHRATLFTLLLEAAKRSGVHLQADSPVAHTGLAGEGRCVKLVDGREIGPFDLVIDASGANSPLSPIKNKTLPFGALWATVDWPGDTTLSAAQLSQKYHGSAIMAGVLPIGLMPNGSVSKAAIFWSMKHVDHKKWRQEPLSKWQEETVLHWPEFAPFVQQTSRHKDFSMARYSHGTLRTPYSTKLVHIGDAAHTASPQLGQGANMALLDAHALALALARDGMPRALETYGLARRNHTRIYQAASYFFTPLYQSDSMISSFLRDIVLAPISNLSPMQVLLSRLVSGDIVPPIQAGLTPRE